MVVGYPRPTLAKALIAAPAVTFDYVAVPDTLQSRTVLEANWEGRVAPVDERRAAAAVVELADWT